MVLRRAAEANGSHFVILDLIMTVRSTNLAAVVAEILSNDDRSHDNMRNHSPAHEGQATLASNARGVAVFEFQTAGDDGPRAKQ
jgi:hypothetical protein